jgi:hypothetical protein
MFNTRCVECELTVMPRPFMVCDGCAAANDRAINRRASVEQAKQPAKVEVSWGTYKVTRPTSGAKK